MNSVGFYDLASTDPKTMADPDGDELPQLDYQAEEAGVLGHMIPRQAIRPLWFIFGGTLICCLIVGVTVRGHGQPSGRLRLTDEPIGAALIMVGVWKLSRLQIDRDYGRLMHFILAVALVEMAKSIVDYFPQSPDPVVALLRIFVSFVSLAAAIAFCRCMFWLCLESDLRHSARGWQRTTVIVCCYCLAAAVAQFLLLLAVLQNAHVKPSQSAAAASSWSWSWSWSWWYLLLVPLFVGPPLAFLFSILQMEREMKLKETRDPGMIVPV